jgi:hypothetical protein
MEDGRTLLELRFEDNRIQGTFMKYGRIALQHFLQE